MNILCAAAQLLSFPSSLALVSQNYNVTRSKLVFFLRIAQDHEFATTAAATAAAPRHDDDDDDDIMQAKRAAMEFEYRYR